MPGDRPFVCKFLDGSGTILAARLLEASTEAAALEEAESLDRINPTAVHAYEVWRDEVLIRRALSSARPGIQLG